MIIHVDMDEFFAAVEKLDNPSLKGKPLLVGGSPEARGVVSTASYEARVFGCRSAMPMAKAIRLCPHAIVLPVRAERYSDVSKQIFEIFKRFTPLVEPVSIDEAFLDITGSQRLFGSARQIAFQIKRAIQDEVGLTASVGVAPNKFLAKLASEMQKPDGLTEIYPDKIQEILDPMKVEKLWGVGEATAKALERLNIHTVKQLRLVDENLLVSRLGKAGAHLHRLARGIDDRQVICETDAKSIGQEHTFARDVSDKDVLKGVLFNQAQDVARRLRLEKMYARTVTVKLRYGDFTTITRGVTLDEPTDVSDELWEAVKGIFEEWSKEHLRALRLVGVTASQLTKTPPQPGLFNNKSDEKFRKVDKAVDDIARKFGESAIRKAMQGDGEPQK